MQRNQELVDFEIDPVTGEVRIVDASAAGKELLAQLKPSHQAEESGLINLIKSRIITKMREDRDDILAACGAQSSVELVFRGHGLSLSDQYWYRASGSTERWEDINFFDNEWDMSFGSAVLSRDYARLASCSPDVPDVTTRGHAIKTWEHNADGIFLIKVAGRFEGAELQGVKLASDLCTLLFDDDRYVPVDIVERHGFHCSASPLMLAGDEELADGKRLCAMAGVRGLSNELNVTVELCNDLIKAYTALGAAEGPAHVAKMACFSCLVLLADLHEGNFGIIRKLGSDTWRPAPIFDYDGAFGFPFQSGLISKLSANPVVAELLCAQVFSFLDPSWDWSWYDSHALDGFEERIIEAYASYRSLPPQLAELVAHLFVVQRDYVNSVVSEGRGL